MDGRTQYVKIVEKLRNAYDIYNRLSVNGLWSSGRWKVVNDYHEALRKLKYCVVPYSTLCIEKWWLRSWEHHLKSIDCMKQSWSPLSTGHWFIWVKDTLEAGPAENTRPLAHPLDTKHKLPVSAETQRTGGYVSVPVDVKLENSSQCFPVIN